MSLAPSQIASHAEMVLAYRLGFEAAESAIWNTKQVNPFTLNKAMERLSECWVYGHRFATENPEYTPDKFATELLEKLQK